MRFSRSFLSIVVLLFTNALLFNLLFVNTPFRVWKQILMLIGYLIFFMRFSSLTQGYKVRYFKTIAWCAYSAIVMAFVLGAAALFKGMSVVRELFAVAMYIGLIPFLLFPLMYVYDVCERKLFRLFGFLAWILGFGLLVDHFTGIFNVFQVGASGFEWMAGKSETYMRASFLFESPTSIVYMGMFCMVSLLFLANSSPKWSGKLVWYAGMLTMVAGLMFTGSRQVWFLVGAMMVIGILGQMFYQRNAVNVVKFMFALPVLILVFAVILQVVMAKSTRADALISRLGVLDDPRVELWQEGIRDNFSVSNMPYWLFGHGLGSSMGQHALSTEEIHTHYESTFLFTFHEGGLAAWFIVYWPSIASMVILMRSRRCFLRYLLRMYVVMYWFASLIAPGTHHFTAQICIFCVLSVSATIDYFDTDAILELDDSYYEGEGEIVEC